MSEQPDSTDGRDDQATIGEEDVATATTRPEADIRTTRPVDDPESLGGSEYYADSETSKEKSPPPVDVVDDPDDAVERND